MIKYREPRWKSYIVKTSDPVFTAEQCDDIIRIGQSYSPEEAKIGVAEKEAQIDLGFLLMIQELFQCIL